ncbi:MAG: phosphoribosylanthranilate isomerase [Xanthomonadales bacterium]
MSPVRVKICGITRPRDVAAAVAAGADALGFVFTERSRRWVDPRQAAGLVRAVPAFVCRVGLFMNADPDEVRRTLRHVPLNLLQFHGDESADHCEQFDRPYIKAVSMAAGSDWRAVLREHRNAAAFLLDSHAPGAAGGTGRVFDWDSIPPIDAPIVLAGGLTCENVAEAVRRVRPWAVDVSSGVEDAPGIKNPSKMRQFISEAKREN